MSTPVTNGTNGNGNFVASPEGATLKEKEAVVEQGNVRNVAQATEGNGANTNIASTTARTNADALTTHAPAVAGNHVAVTENFLLAKAREMDSVSEHSGSASFSFLDAVKEVQGFVDHKGPGVASAVKSLTENVVCWLNRVGRSVDALVLAKLAEKLMDIAKECRDADVCAHVVSGIQKILFRANELEKKPDNNGTVVSVGAVANIGKMLMESLVLLFSLCGGSAPASGRVAYLSFMLSGNNSTNCKVRVNIVEILKVLVRCSDRVNGARALAIEILREQNGIALSNQGTAHDVCRFSKTLVRQYLSMAQATTRLVEDHIILLDTTDGIAEDMNPIFLFCEFLRESQSPSVALYGIRQLMNIAMKGNSFRIGSTAASMMYGVLSTIDAKTENTEKEVTYLLSVLHLCSRACNEKIKDRLVSIYGGTDRSIIESVLSEIVTSLRNGAFTSAEVILKFLTQLYTGDLVHPGARVLARTTIELVAGEKFMRVRENKMNGTEGLNNVAKGLVGFLNKHLDDNNVKYVDDAIDSIMKDRDNSSLHRRQGVVMSLVQLFLDQQNANFYVKKVLSNHDGWPNKETMIGLISSLYNANFDYNNRDMMLVRSNTPKRINYSVPDGMPGRYVDESFIICEIKTVVVVRLFVNIFVGFISELGDKKYMEFGKIRTEMRDIFVHVSRLFYGTSSESKTEMIPLLKPILELEFVKSCPCTDFDDCVKYTVNFCKSHTDLLSEVHGTIFNQTVEQSEPEPNRKRHEMEETASKGSHNRLVPEERVSH
ncbi:MAG: hypothetical protein LBR91_03860 [Puniceicoccales bacterium]|jgi:hypothetical protein|nr:hypothetical protein [Puniceicoccales bacterium]